MKLVSIVVPCHNEDGNVKKLMDELNKELNNSQYEYEFIFVNDGSEDKTIEKLNELSEQDQRVKVIDFSRNFGKEAAVLAGLDFSQGDAVIVMDADLQMPVFHISDFLKLWAKGCKLVLTFRSNRAKGIKAKLASKYYDVYNQISDTQIIKDALDFQLMDREVVAVICSMRERARFFKGITGYIGYDYQVIPVEMHDRTSGVSNFSGLKGLFNYAFKSFAIHSDAPLRSAINIGVFISLIAFIYMSYIVIRTLVKGVDVGGYASTMSVMLFMFGLILLFLGVIGYYLGLMYNEIKQRPNYIVKDKKNIDK